VIVAARRRVRRCEVRGAESAWVAREVAAWRGAVNTGEPGVARAHALSSCRRRRIGRSSGRENARLNDPSRIPPPQRRNCWGWRVGVKRELAEMRTTSGYSVSERDASDHARPIRQWRAGAHVSIRISSIRADKTHLGAPRLPETSFGLPARHETLAAAAIAHRLRPTLSVRSESQRNHGPQVHGRKYVEF
jgi:hypothetical protein